MANQSSKQGSQTASDSTREPSISSKGKESASSSSTTRSAWEKVKKIAKPNETPEEKQKRKDDYEKLRSKNTMYGQPGGVKFQ